MTDATAAVSFTSFRLACFRLATTPPIATMKRANARSAHPKTQPQSSPDHCPGFSEIAVPYLLKRVSGI
jgi:hypothetical protein